MAVWATVETVDPSSRGARWVNDERRQYVLMILAWAMLVVDVLAEIVRLVGGKFSKHPWLCWADCVGRRRLRPEQ